MSFQAKSYLQRKPVVKTWNSATKLMFSCSLVMVIFSFAALAVLHVTFDWNGKRLDKFVENSKLAEETDGLCVIRKVQHFIVKSKASGPEVKKEAFVLTCIFKDLPTGDDVSKADLLPVPKGMEDYDKETLQLALGRSFEVNIESVSHSTEGKVFSVKLGDLKRAKIVKKSNPDSGNDASAPLL